MYVVFVFYFITSFSYIFVYCFSFSVYSVHQTSLLVMQPMFIRFLYSTYQQLNFVVTAAAFLQVTYTTKQTMGNSIEQYRAAIGLFYMSGRGISKKHPFLVFSSVYILLLLNNIFKILAHCMKCTSHRSVYINFYIQFFTFILLACGDIQIKIGIGMQ